MLQRIAVVWKLAAAIVCWYQDTVYVNQRLHRGYALKLARAIAKKRRSAYATAYLETPLTYWHSHITASGRSGLIENRECAKMETPITFAQAEDNFCGRLLDKEVIRVPSPNCYDIESGCICACVNLGSRLLCKCTVTYGDTNASKSGLHMWLTRERIHGDV